MPEIRPSADLRNNYNEISEFCHKTGEPIYITRNGRSDLVVISSEEFDRFKKDSRDYHCFEGGTPVRLTEEKLCSLIDKSLRDIEAGEVMPLEDGMAAIRSRLSDV